MPRGGINPRTLQPYRLSDPEIAWHVRAMQFRVCRSPGAARAWLIEAEFLTKSGRIPRKYGGR